MERKRKIPAEAVELYTRYIHGEVSRRDFFVEVKRFAFAGLTAAAIVEGLMPNYALGQQVAKNDERIMATYETVPSPNGNGMVPAGLGPLRLLMPSTYLTGGHLLCGTRSMAIFTPSRRRSTNPTPPFTVIRIPEEALGARVPKWTIPRPSREAVR